jgi:hypothetical protein
MKGFINLLFLIVALESACYLCQMFNVFGSALNYPLGITSITGFANYFSFERLGFAALIGGVGAAAVMIIGVMTRQGTYALYAMLIFGLGAFIPLISDFILAAPNTIYAVVSATGIAGITIGTDPSTGQAISAWEPLAVTIGLWAAVWGALYVFGLIFQRDIHT